MRPVIPNRERTPVTDMERRSSHVLAPCSRITPNQRTQCHQWNDRLPNVIMRPRMVRDPCNRLTEKPLTHRVRREDQKSRSLRRDKRIMKLQTRIKQQCSHQMSCATFSQYTAQKNPILCFRSNRAQHQISRHHGNSYNCAGPCIKTGMKQAVLHNARSSTPNSKCSWQGNVQYFQFQLPEQTNIIVHPLLTSHDAIAASVTCYRSSELSFHRHRARDKQLRLNIHRLLRCVTRNMCLRIVFVFRRTYQITKTVSKTVAVKTTS